MRILRYVPGILNFWSSKGKNNREGKRKIFEEGKYLVSGREENRGGKGKRKGRKIFGHWRRRKTEKEKEENIWRRSVKDVEKSRFRSRDFCQFLEGFGIGFGEFGLGKKVSVSVSEYLVSKKSLGFGKHGLGKKSRFQRICLKKKSRISFGQKFGIVILWTAKFK